MNTLKILRCIDCQKTLSEKEELGWMAWQNRYEKTRFSRKPRCGACNAIYTENELRAKTDPRYTTADEGAVVSKT